MGIKEQYGEQYKNVEIRTFGNKTTHILFERMCGILYLHEWTNDGQSRDGIELGKLFLKRFRNVPIVCSTLKDKVVRVAKRYGFDIYKRVNDRLFLIRKVG